MDSLPKLNSCCCGCSLKTGTKIIGWFGLIFSLCILIGAITGFVFALTAEKPADEKENTTFTILLMISIIYLIAGAISSIINLMLLIGVYQEKSSFVKVYVIVCAIGIAFTIIGILLALFSAGSMGKEIIQNIISLVFEVYFFLVVNSYYFTMPGVGTGATYA